jgi:hypothetical protein
MEFALADLIVSGRLAPGSRVVVEHRAGQPHLCFVLSRARAEARAPLDELEINVG